MALEGIAFLLVFIAAFTVAGRSFIVINQYEEGLKFQYGRYLTKLLPGINFIIPFIDLMYQKLTLKSNKQEYRG